MPSTFVLLCGPSLPGRWRLARALEQRAGARRLAECTPEHAPILPSLATGPSPLLVDGALPTARGRRKLLDAVGAADRLLVEWSCTPELAERECFHRYASRPELLARAEWQRYCDDMAQREPVAEAELPGRVLHVDAALPIDDAVAAVMARVPAAHPSPPVWNKRVLVVEDDADQRALLADVLRELGFAVELAPDAGVALALLDDGAHVDLLITDHKMPGMSGVELTRAVRRRHPDVRTVLLTAFGDDRTCLEAVAADAVTLLEKPLRVCDLTRVLDEATARNCPTAP